MINLYTIGYEGVSLGDFLRRLIAARVDLVIDVRELPLSRRKGFSKTTLAAALEKCGIRYVHRRELGAPKTIRYELRETGDYKTYFRRFNTYLETQRALLEQLVEECSDTNVTLMCFEKNPAECHRSAVARELGKIAELEPVHLQVLGEAHHGYLRKAPRLHPSQSASAA
jgi:uncharacterized protein (DUF488 family)